MNISIIDHAGLNVRDLNRSASWYKWVLGFDIVHKWTTTWMVGKGRMRLGLFQRPQATPVDDIDNKIAITHLAFLTNARGFEAVQKELKEKGVPFDPPEDSGIAKSLFVEDPDGHVLEITYYYAKISEEAADEFKGSAAAGA